MPNPNKNTVDLAELTTSLASIKEKYTKTKADMCDVAVEHDKMCELASMCDSLFFYCDSLARYCQSLQNQIWDTNDSLWTHANGGTHLPPILGPEKMENAVKKLGLDGDYEIKKKMVFASEIKGNTLEISLNKA